jgi:hypothetical protein
MTDDGCVSPFHGLAGAYVDCRRVETHETQIDDGSRIRHRRFVGGTGQPAATRGEESRYGEDMTNGQWCFAHVGSFACNCG